MPADSACVFRDCMYKSNSKKGMKTVSHAAGMSGIIILEAIKEYEILCRGIHKATSG